MNCEANDAVRLNRTLALISALAALMLAAWVNRKLETGFLEIRRLDALRLRDLLTLFVLAPLGILLMWELFKVSAPKAGRKLAWLFITAVFLLGMGFGMHEPTNAIRVAGLPAPEALRDSLRFFDDDLGHWIFFAGFALCVLTFAAAETESPFERPLPAWAVSMSILSGLAVAASIYGNMAWEDTAPDLAVMLACLAAVFVCHARHGFVSLKRLPMTLSMYVSLGLGNAATLVHWSIG